MAAHKLLDDDAREAAKFDVIGMSVKPDYINHLAVLSEPVSIRHGMTVDVFEMKPPLLAGQLDPNTSKPLYGTGKAHAVGWIDDLSVDERRYIEIWIKDTRTKVPSNIIKCYIIDPPWYDILEKGTRRIMSRRFSCAGFVLRCYEEGLGIRLLDCTPDCLPPVDRALLESIYDEDTLEVLDRLGDRLGITGPPPWRIVLCGYVLHALNRPVELIRTTPHRVSGVEEAEFPFDAQA